MLARLNDAVQFYQSCGYEHVEHAPWLVSTEISNLTKPIHRQNFMVRDRALVASGEQSFLQMIHDQTLAPGKYVTCTPCFRDESILDDTHHLYFQKVELIWWDEVSMTTSQLQKVVQDAKRFLKRYRVETSMLSMDEGTAIDLLDDDTRTELGSYGIRSTKFGDRQIHWIYGTGLAEPRFSNVLSRIQKPGYHVAVIPKGTLGDLSKLQEELMEAVDAEQQSNPIMTLVELSDLYGAMESYLEKRFAKCSMNDLATMSRTTKRAFTNGRRRVET